MLQGECLIQFSRCSPLKVFFIWIKIERSPRTTYTQICSHEYIERCPKTQIFQPKRRKKKKKHLGKRQKVPVHTKIATSLSTCQKNQNFRWSTHDPPTCPLCGLQELHTRWHWKRKKNETNGPRFTRTFENIVTITTTKIIPTIIIIKTEHRSDENLGRF